MFADDVLLYKVVRSLSDFQSDIDSLVQWISDHNQTQCQKVQIAFISKETGANMYSNYGG